MVTNVYAKSKYDRLRIDKASGKSDNNNKKKKKSKNHVRSDWGTPYPR